MQYSQVYAQMMKLDNGFHPDTINQVHRFLNQHIGSLAHEQPRYHIAAASAIVCQCTKVPAVGNIIQQVSLGIKVESIMKRLTTLSKDKFLDTINIQIQKYITAEHHLKEKIPKIRLAYRSFKKYKNIFNELSTMGSVPNNITSDFSSFFWIVYLLIKIKTKAIDDIEDSTKILIFLLQQAFTQFLSHLDLAIVDQVIQRQQNFSFAPNVSVQQKGQYSSCLHQEIANVYIRRTSNLENSFTNLIKDEILLSRLVDDLSDEYDKTFNKLPEGRYIDEITFLGLEKNLTPQPVHKKVQGQMISKRINFDDEDDQTLTEKKHDSSFSEMDEEAPVTFNNFSFMQLSKNKPKEPEKIQKKSQNRFSQQSKLMTPLSFGMAKASWVKNCLKTVSSSDQQKIINFITESGKSSVRMKEKIKKCIEEFASHSIKKETSLQEIFKLFIYLTLELSKQISIGKIQFKISSFIDQILCLAACLYNFAIRSLSIEFKNYCNVFEIDMIKGFEIIFYLGSLDIHNMIREYLFEIEKLILIKELWDTDLGYQLLIQGKMRNQTLLSKRLYRHIQERVKEICSRTGVEISLEEKITTLVVDILNEKYELLHGNKLDQIIICSITACLRINESKHATAVSQIFHHYNQSSYSFQSIQKGLNFRQGKMNLMDFYNLIFVVEVEDMMRHNQVAFICTPIRQQQLKKVRGNTNIPPISHLSNFGKPMNLSGNRSQNEYQNRLRKDLNKRMQKNEEEMVPQQKEEGQSPRFGPPSLKRTITFGSS